MKLLVSGATGFIGHHLCKRLIEQGHDVTAIVRPTTSHDSLNRASIHSYTFQRDVDGLIEYMQGAHFDGVVHLASLFLAQHKPDDISGLIESNLFFSTALLEAAVSAKVPWFLNTGTFWQHYKNADYSPVNLYAATKQAFEVIAQYYIETSDVTFVTITLSDTFGPGDTRAKIFNVWSKISQSGEEFDMSPGKQIMDINYVDNVIDGYMRMIDLLSGKKARQMNGQSFAISSQERMTLKQLAQNFGRVTGTTLHINWGKKPYRPREVMIPWENGQPVPGWKPRVGIEEGIKRTFIREK